MCIRDRYQRRVHGGIIMKLGSCIWLCLALGLAFSVTFRNLENKLSPNLPSSEPESETPHFHLTLRLNEEQNDQKLRKLKFLEQAQRLAQMHAEYTVLTDIHKYKSKKGRGTTPDRDEFEMDHDNKIIYLPLLNEMNTRFVGEVDVGTPPQRMKAIFDTGSGNLVVNSFRCYDVSCLSKNRFDSQSSSTYKTKGSRAMIHYGGSKVEGVINIDDVSIAGLKLRQQEFLEVTHEKTASPTNTGAEVIVGLGLPSLALRGLTPIFENMVRQNLLKENIFSFYLSRVSNEYVSKISFGGIDPEMVQEKLRWFPIISDAYWSVKLDAVYIGNKDSGICHKGSCKAILDTGTSFLSFPSAKLTKIQSMYKIHRDCSNFQELPTLTYVIGGHNFTLEPWEYILTMNTTTPEEAEALYHHSTNVSYCAGLFVPLDLPGKYADSFILGDVFLTKFFSAFDRRRMRIGLALAKNYSNIEDTDKKSEGTISTPIESEALANRTNATSVLESSGDTPDNSTSMPEHYLENAETNVIPTLKANETVMNLTNTSLA
eukprot:TRINITY_DN223_c0_g2_i1.p1 TRINITY_DN223_c0_g2~~TRINITY_DN223_c0_g2_i1.p1  ORF type:complete len:543 (+),score=77.53 TRINITY_DN223_c0_g2_i1:66-1694(+)